MRIKYLILATTFAGLLTSCKKNSLDEQAMATNTTAADKAKAWFEKESTNAATLNKTNSTTLSFKENLPDWNRTVSFSNDNSIVTPVNIVSSNKENNGKVSQMLITKTGVTGEVESSYYSFVLNKDAKVIDPALVATGKIPSDFNGAIINYSTDGQIISAKHYTKGQVTSTGDKLTVKANEGLKEPGGEVNLAPPPPCDDGGGQVCIDWYWQTWENGVLIFEEYLFTSCHCGGGGGGGGHGSVTDPDAAFMEFIKNGHSTSISISELTTFESPKHRTSKYEWKYFEENGFGEYKFYSREFGNQDMQPDGNWKFTSLNHSTDWKTGSSTNWFINSTIVDASPSIGTSIWGWSLATMKLEFNLHYEFELSGFHRFQDGRGNSTHTWNTENGAPQLH